MGQVWVLTCGLSLLALAVWVGEIATYPATGDVTPAVWLTLATGFGIAQSLVVHLHFRQNAHSFSMSEVPLLIGLFFTSPFALVTAQIAGASVALTLHQRQAPVKLAFNLAALALEATFAIFVFHVACSSLDPNSVTSKLGAFPASLASTLTAVLLVFAAISLSQGHWRIVELGRPVAFGLIASVFTTSLGVAVVILIQYNWVAVLFLGLPTSGVYAATWAYTRERQRHTSLEFLYQSAKGLAQARQIEPALIEALRMAREAFRTDVAEAYLRSTNNEEMLRTAVGPGETTTAFAPTDITDLAEIWAHFSVERGAIVTNRSEKEGPFRAYLEHRGWEDALFAPLRGETHLLGFLVVADRNQIVRYGRDDLQLAETLANQIAVALENVQLERSLEQLQTLKDELTHQAFHDPLTGLANRALFGNRVNKAFERSSQSRPVAIFFVDLDDFKTVNDSRGHAVGDKLLVGLGNRLTACVRDGDLVARLGGDEFALLLENPTTIVDPLAFAERVQNALSEPIDIDGTRMLVRLSIGVATSQYSLNAEQLLRNADVAMYAAKQRGKNQIAMFEPSLLEAAVDRYDLTTDLQSAVANQEFVTLFQPFVNLRTHEVAGVEALIRWNHPQRGFLSPISFVGLAEESEIIEAITRFVLERSLAFLRRADEILATPAPIFVSVNLSTRDIDSRDIVRDVTDALARFGTKPSRLLLEVSEAAMFHDAKVGLSNLDGLREMGTRIALDDFGTGYSSLGRLKELPIDVIKLDKLFVDDIAGDQAAQAMAAAMIRLGHVLKKEIIAEGIETGPQCDRLTRVGCDFGQGYFLARPMPQDECLIWMMRWVDGQIAA